MPDEVQPPQGVAVESHFSRCNYWGRLVWTEKMFSSARMTAVILHHSIGTSKGWSGVGPRADVVERWLVVD